MYEGGIRGVTAGGGGGGIWFKDWAGIALDARASFAVSDLVVGFRVYRVYL